MISREATVGGRGVAIFDNAYSTGTPSLSFIQNPTGASVKPLKGALVEALKETSLEPFLGFLVKEPPYPRCTDLRGLRRGAQWIILKP